MTYIYYLFVLRQPVLKSWFVIMHKTTIFFYLCGTSVYSGYTQLYVLNFINAFLSAKGIPVIFSY